MFDWNVQVHDLPASMAVDIYIYREHPRGHREFLINGGKEIRTVEEGFSLPSISKLVFARLDNREIADKLLAALQNSGFTLPKADHTAGKLEATERHLDDMRKLVFKEKK